MASIPVHSIYDEDRYYRCCCNQFHVERGAKIIAFLGAVLSAIFAVLQFVSGNLILFIFGLFHFLIYWSILYAQRKRQPFLYTPFLFINGLSLFFMGLYIIFLVVMLILLPDFWRNREPYGDKTKHDTALDADLRNNCRICDRLLLLCDLARLQIHETGTHGSNHSPQSLNS
ncbi:hypothetical protein Ddc_11342 [Ditylenchus destructor]|nr:hypothetical protein Ddc_11342 [Ditylenchus destructor]